MPKFAPDLLVTKHPPLALENQGRGGYVEEYHDTTYTSSVYVYTSMTPAHVLFTSYTSTVPDLLFTSVS